MKTDVKGWTIDKEVDGNMQKREEAEEEEAASAVNVESKGSTTATGITTMTTSTTARESWGDDGTSTSLSLSSSPGLTRIRNYLRRLRRRPQQHYQTR